MCTVLNVFSLPSSVCLFLQHPEYLLFQPLFVVWDVSVGRRLMAAREQISGR